MQPRKFTLIELLIVIVIISILAAILLPMLWRARAKARDITCRNNIRQIGIYVILYGDDYGVYPFREIVGGGLYYNWGRAIWEGGYCLPYSIGVSPLARPYNAKLFCLNFGMFQEHIL